MMRSLAVRAFAILCLVVASPSVTADIPVDGKSRRSNGPVPRVTPSPPAASERGVTASAPARDEVVPAADEVREPARGSAVLTIGLAVLAGGLLLLFVLRPRTAQRPAQRTAG